jgi:hypothetical protein
MTLRIIREDLPVEATRLSSRLTQWLLRLALKLCNTK